MKYSLYDELVKALGEHFQESTADFYILKQYMEHRLKHLVYQKDSLQHFGCNDSIFRVKDLETGKVYQGFWSNVSQVLSISPTYSYQDGDCVFSFKASSLSKQASFREVEEKIITIENISEEFDVNVFIHTKIYNLKKNASSNLQTSFLGDIDTKLMDARCIPDCEFTCEIGEDFFSFENKSVGYPQGYETSEHSVSIRPQTLLDIYFEMMGDAFQISDKVMQKKKTI